MKHFSRLSITFVLVMLLAVIAQKAEAQTYSVDYQDKPIGQVIKDLRSKTGYEFVYQKQVLQGVPNITCHYTNLNISQLLNRVIMHHAGLDYEIVKKNIVLKKAAPKKGDGFKKTVVGIVEDNNGEALVGATVMQESTGNGTTTDVDGAFTMLVEGNEPVLTISYIGHKTKKVRLKSDEKFVEVELQGDETILDEVLVTGYQNIKRENATGSYQLITSKELDKRYTGSIVENLEGQVPGLVSYNNGLNGDGESGLTIRGIGSFEARTNPLVVVDGLPIEGSIESVNPYNIANITVLKDASATSIYGARANNGVIVITTKKASQEKVEIDFNADLTISEKQDYSNFGWISSSQLVDLEQYNFNAMKADADQNAFNGLLTEYQRSPHAISVPSRLLVANHLGEISDSEMKSQLDALRRNDYRREWQDAYKRAEILQQYNLGIRTRGKYLSSNIVLNYKNDNTGTVNESNSALTFSYHGDLNLKKWLKMSFGANIVSERMKQNVAGSFCDINSFLPYMSMYNADGTRAQMEADIYLDEPSLQDPQYGFKPVGYNLLDEMGMGYDKSRRTNLRSFVNATATILPGWTASAYFQYEDIYYKRNRYKDNNSYDMRYLYNLYTQTETSMVTDWIYDPDLDDYVEVQIPTTVISHHIPTGGMLTTNTTEGAYYTFRAQTAFNKTIAQKHEIDALAGFEFRESKYTSYSNILLGYDDQTQTNRNNLVNFGVLQDKEGSVSALGVDYFLYGAPTGSDFATSEVLHRFYSLYFTGNYTFDHRYSLSASYRVDKTDLFGADPEFRGRPLWSVGGSWNMHNETWMKQYEWIDALKLRASYGLTGNIDSNVSSYLTATLANEYIYGNLGATLDTPPNDRLRWEKTASMNLGVDFSFLGNRISGSLDYYVKKGSDLLTTTDLDPTTGWSQLTINNGKMTNRGVELQLNGVILQPATRNDLGINAAFNIAYNHNEVTQVNHKPTSGMENLFYYTLHEGYPVHSLFSYQFAGLQEADGLQFVTWRDHLGEIHNTEISSSDFTVDDAVYCGSLDPKVTASLTPQITYAGFTLSAMFSYYGGHYMRANVDKWQASGSNYGYKGLEAKGDLSASLLDYWQSGDNTSFIANGYRGSTNVVGYSNVQYMDALVVPADYLKLRNIVAGYNFPNSICRRIGINEARLRLQMNNIGTWARNKYDIDPEANNPYYGTPTYKTPRSYTMSLYLNF